MNERSIFLAALDIPDLAERAAYLEQACAADATLRRGVDDLLAAHNRSGSFMPEPAAATATQDYEPAERPGARVGPYKLLQQIGEGGMGAVFMAEQQEPVRRMVALKIIRQGMDTRAVLARFEAERQALALMDHPNIARVLDAGTTDSGRPFFVMELVKGVPITRFCDKQQLTLHQRLELFVPVCQAIQHAHQKGVIHRDIKPSNVLVALYDDRPVPKVIDFGVAKATSQKLTDRTLFTVFGAVVGTLEYMSPEQATLNQLDIDTRSDVYSLGVLLYELLTGSTPIDRSRVKTVALDEVLRLIREEEAPRPSTRLSTAQTVAQIAAGRHAEPRQLGKMLRGELDWIVMKALEKDRTRRYETANGLARDVERYLRDEAVEACPPTLGYRLRKAYRKNRAAVLVSATFLAVVSVAAVTGTMLAIQARRAEIAASAERDRAQRSAAEAIAQRAAAERERRRAEQEKRSAQAVRDFLSDDLLHQASWFQQAESRRLSGEDYEVKPNPTIRELLDRAATRLAPDKIEARFPGMPAVQAEVLATVGDSYLWIGQIAKSIELLSRAGDLHHASGDSSSPAALDVRQALAMAHFSDGRQAEAIAMMQAICDDRRRVQGAGHPDTFTSRERLGTLYLGTRPKEALAYLKQLKDDARARFGPDHLHTLYTAHGHAVALIANGRVEEAIRDLEMVRDKAQHIGFPADHPYAINGLLTLADAYRSVGRTREGIDEIRFALQMLDSTRGPSAPATRSFRRTLAGWLLQARRPVEAIAECEKLLATLPPDADELARAQDMNLLGHAYTAVGRHRDELALREKIAAIYKDRLPADDRRLLDNQKFLAWSLARLGRKGESVPMLEELIRRTTDSRGANHTETLSLQMALCHMLRSVDPERSAVVAADVVARRRAIGDLESRDMAEALGTHGSILRNLRRFDDAEPLLRTALAVWQGREPQAWDTAKTKAELGMTLLSQKRYEAAEPLLLDAYKALIERVDSKPAYDSNSLPAAAQSLVDLYEALNRTDEVARWQAERAKYPPVAPRQKETK